MSRAEVYLHPLVMVNMADHYTRNKVLSNSSNNLRTIGAFVGIQESSIISILDSMEMKLLDVTKVDLNLVKRKLQLTQQCFPRFELLGWYLVGPILSDAEMLTIHKQIQELNESPLVMVMQGGEGKNKATSTTTGALKEKVLPVTVYETVMHIVNEQPLQTFVEVPVKIETTESERVTVDHVVTQRTTTGGGGANTTASAAAEASTLNPHMAALKNAVQMLRGRVLILKRFLELSKSGKIPMDHELLREADAVCNQLPALEPSLVQLDFTTQLSDALLISLLAAVTKETASIGGVLEKFFLAYPNPGAPERVEKSKSKRGLAPGGKGRMI
jgi:COP9 signalosome complex subunit 6